MRERNEKKEEGGQRIEMNFGEGKAVQILKQILELEPIEFLGICKILGVETITTSEPTFESSEEGGPAKIEVIPRNFGDIWTDVCDTVNGLNRAQKRNLQKLVKSATKKEK